ncbi:hypothetical protein IFR05_017074 [Cadophora sp. M221]|nr:hypothetical protein IFR05_017074 [Cadophora sp. M221]
MSSNDTIFLTGGTGKVSSRLASILSAAGNPTIIASRSGTSFPLPNIHGVKFDWDKPETWSSAFENASITAAFLVAPPINDCAPPVIKFIDFSIGKGVKRFVLLSASMLPVEDGPMMSQISKYIVGLGLEYAILRPSWFMENFSELQHQPTIQNGDRIVTATGEGKVPFIAASDIAAVAFRALTDEKPHNTDHVILGPELLSYTDVATILSQKLGRKITHKSITEKELILSFENTGYEPDLVKGLAAMDTAIRNGAEEMLNDDVLTVTGRKPKTLEVWVDEVVGTGVWEKL